ncbi:MAG: MarR family transcriptional regulator [Kofleriaceae bacterium]
MGSHASDAAAVIQALRRIVRMIRLADRDDHSGHSLSAAQLFVLHSLATEPASSLAELAKRTLTDQSSVSTVVAKLVAKKLVKRTRSTADRRRAELVLTAAGQRVVKHAPPLVQTRIVDAVAALPAKPRRDLVKALSMFVDAIGATQVEATMFSEES